MKKSHRYVMSSLWEGMPNTILEAISVNTLCISTDCKNGPREILCPEIPFDKEITYPYYGTYGILTKAFPRRYIFDDITTTPLIEEEVLLAHTMLDVIKQKEKYEQQYASVNERGKQYDRSNHTEFWESLIENTDS